MADDKPPEPTTKQIYAVDPSFEMLKRIEGKVDMLRGDVSLVSNDLGIVKERVGIIEVWKAEQESWSRRNSARVREIDGHTSQVDLAHDAKIADTTIRLVSVEKKVDSIAEETRGQTEILKSLARVAANPVVKGIANAVGTAILAWLAMRGIK